MQPKNLLQNTAPKRNCSCLDIPVCRSQFSAKKNSFLLFLITDKQ